MSAEEPVPLRLVEPPAPKVDPLIGQVLDGRYRIERMLGEGGMGVVYKATHAVIGKPLAVKVLRGEVSRDAEVVARFKQEAQSATAIGNEHIIDITDFGVLPEGATYFVMEFLDGISLSHTIEHERPLSAVRTMAIGKQLCDALSAAHERGIVHRDLKPDNVYLIRRHGTKDFVKVLDFGIAKVAGGTSKLTKAGQVFGTPHYMSPEQCAGTAVDARTDVYAVGVILYEMAAGRVPFDADNLMGILTKHLYENPIPPRELPPPTDVTPGLEAIIMKCLSKKPELRYQSMEEMKADLERAEHGETTAAVAEAVERSSGGAPIVREPTARTGITMGVGDVDELETPRRSVLPLVLGVLAVALVVGVGGTAAWYFLGRGETVIAANDPALPTTGVPPIVSPPQGPAAQGPEGAQHQGSSTVQAPVPPVAPASPRAAVVTTTPAGAKVMRDGVIVCVATPCSVPLPTGGDLETLDVLLDGYHTQRIALSSVSDPAVTLTLQARRHGERDRVTVRRLPPAAQTAHAPTPPVPAELHQPPLPPPVEHPRARTPDPDDLPRIRSPEVVDPWAATH